MPHAKLQPSSSENSEMVSVNPTTVRYAQLQMMAKEV